MLTGNLQKRSGKYYAVINLKVDGKRKPKWILTDIPDTERNRKKAEHKLAELLAEYSEKQKTEQAEGADALFADYMQSWLKAQQSRIATATYQSYSSMINSRVERWFRPKGITLGGLKPQEIEQFYQQILDDGHTTNTVIHYHAVLRKALQAAVRKDILKANPADKVDRPKKNSYSASHYTEAEMMTLLELIEGDVLELVITIAAYYGLRRSEVLGLRWSAISFERNTVSVNHKVIEVEENGAFVPRGEDVLKTKSSHRTLPLIPLIREKLLLQKQKQEVHQKVLGKAYCAEYPDYICTNDFGVLLRPNYVTEHFGWLIRKYGLKKIRFHDLRHTCASLLLANGVPMKSIQVWLGHSTFSTTADIYSHLDFSAHEQSAEVMGSLFEDKKAAAEESQWPA